MDVLLMFIKNDRQMKKKTNKKREKNTDEEFIYELLNSSKLFPELNKKILINLINCLLQKNLSKIKKMDDMIIEIEE
jgi:hypothetical protein